MLVGGRHDSVRLAFALIVLFLTAISSTSIRDTMTGAYLELPAAWASVSSMQVRVMLNGQARGYDFVGSGG